MLTTCPECATTFRIGHEQLDARQGMVRCGRCNAVFNAYDALRAEIEAPVETAPAEVAVDEGMTIQAMPPISDPAGEGGLDSVLAETTENASSEALPDHDPDARTAEELPTWLEDREEDKDHSSDDNESLLASAMPENAHRPVRREIDDILLSELPGRASRTGDQAPLGLRILAGTAGFVLALLLAAQLTYFLRAPIVAWLPELRRPAGQLCAVIGCDLPLAREIGALRIDASSLETDPEQAAHARLRITFSNRSSQTLEWPHFILKLTDVHNTVMTQRVFRPREYLKEGTALGKGIAARGEHEFQLDLDIGKLNAAGYEVRPHYP